MRYEVDLSEASKFARTPAYGIPVIRAAAACGPDGGTLGATNRFLTRDGSPWIPIAGEMHYSRIAAERWDTELAKMAAAGIDVVSTYVFWNHHEEREGEWDFSGNRNVRRFVELCARHGLHVIVRLGPFCHGEVRNGGLPDWLYGKSYEVRSLDAGFLDAVRGLYAHIAQQLRGLYFKDGGPIIAAQVDNEYMASSAPWEMTTGISREWVPSGHDGPATWNGCATSRSRKASTRRCSPAPAGSHRFRTTCCRCGVDTRTGRGCSTTASVPRG